MGRWVGQKIPAKIECLYWMAVYLKKKINGGITIISIILKILVRNRQNLQKNSAGKFRQFNAHLKTATYWDCCIYSELLTFLKELFSSWSWLILPSKASNRATVCTNNDLSWVCGVCIINLWSLLLVSATFSF